MTAVLVARNGAQYLPATLAALAAQSRRPDRVVAVDAGSTDGSRALLAEGLPDGSIVVPTGRATLAQAANTALLHLDAREDEWFWILGHDAAPQRRALEALLGAIEVSPSVALVGPKLMRWDESETLVGFGETLDAFGGSLRLAPASPDTGSSASPPRASPPPAPSSSSAAAGAPPPRATASTAAPRCTG